jgi:hypothetical protein
MELESPLFVTNRTDLAAAYSGTSGVWVSRRRCSFRRRAGRLLGLLRPLLEIHGHGAHRPQMPRSLSASAALSAASIHCLFVRLLYVRILRTRSAPCLCATIVSMVAASYSTLINVYGAVFYLQYDLNQAQTDCD